jgi:uncharacterized protein (TIGR02594 family)
MSKGSIDYAMPDFQDPFKGFREELGNIETKRKQSQEKAFKMAEMIEMADSATMFGNDYSIATKWAQNLTDNLSSMSSSTEGMVQFAQQANMLKSFIDGSEAYRTENIGSVKDGPQAGHWQGAVQRNISGVNPYGDQADTNSMSEYESRYKDLNESLDVAFDENGSPIIRKGGREMALSQYQRPENPFMPSLAESLFSESGFNYYDGVQDAMKNAHVSAEAAKTWAESSLLSDPRKLRGIVNSHLKTRDTNMTLDEAMSGNNSAVVREALDGFLDDVGRAWNTRHGEDFEDLEDTLFTGGFSAPEGMETVTAGFQPLSEADYVDVYSDAAGLLDNLSRHRENVEAADHSEETLGFSHLRTLATPITEDYADGLGEFERITSIQVDRNGDIHATLEVVTEVWGENDPQHMLEPTLVKEKRPVTYTQNEAMHASLKNYLGAGTSQDVYSKMMLESLSNSKAQRTARTQRAFDSAFAAEELRNLQPPTASTEATPTATEIDARRNAERSVNNQNSPFLNDREVYQQEIMRAIDPSGAQSFQAPELFTLVEDAIDAGYDKEAIVNVLQSQEWQKNKPTVYRETWRDRLIGASQTVGDILSFNLAPAIGRRARKVSEAEENRSNLFRAFEEAANPTLPVSDVDVEDAEPAGVDPDVVDPVALEDAGVDPSVAENLREEAPETTAAVETTITQAANNGIDISKSDEATEEQHLEEMTRMVESQNSLLRFVGVNEAQLGDSLTEVYRALQGNSSQEAWDPVNKAWCALFTAHILTEGGFPIEDLPNDKFVAKKYNTIGIPVYRSGKGEFDSSKLKYGDVVIMNSSNPNAASWNGHVAFYVGMTPNGKIQLFGGNQNDSINIAQFDTKLIYGIRRMSFDTSDMEKATKALGLGDANASTD